MSKKTDALLQEYDGLRRELENRGYSGIMKCVEMAPKKRLICRLIQLICEAMVVFYIAQNEWVSPMKWLDILLLSSSILMLVVVVWLISYLITHLIMTEIWCANWKGKELLPQGSYHAGLILKEKIDVLKAELEVADKKMQESEEELEKFGKVAMVIEDTLKGRCETVRHVGEEPYIRVWLTKDATVARRYELSPEHYDKLILDASKALAAMRVDEDENIRRFMAEMEARA